MSQDFQTETCWDPSTRQQDSEQTLKATDPLLREENPSQVRPEDGPDELGLRRRNQMTLRNVEKKTQLGQQSLGGLEGIQRLVV